MWCNMKYYMMTWLDNDVMLLELILKKINEVWIKVDLVQWHIIHHRHTVLHPTFVTRNMHSPSHTAPGAQETGWAGPGHVLWGGELHDRLLEGANSGPRLSPTNTTAVTGTGTVQSLLQLLSLTLLQPCWNAWTICCKSFKFLQYLKYW
jgi:hypothetical protein